MKFNVNIMYEEGYLQTPRCRKLRYRDKKETVTTEIREVSKSNMELSFYVEDSLEADTEVYAFEGKLWKEVRERGMKTGRTPMENLIHTFEKSSIYYCRYDYQTGRKETKEDILKRLQEDCCEKLIVDGILYRQTQEPMYCIYTFGLGHNHAGIGTSLSVVWWYNENISHKAYFSALELEKAREQAIKTALGRGDTDSVKYIEKCDIIKVYHPEYVTRNPAKDHGDGNEFLNHAEAIISNTDSSTEAAILLMASV